MSFLKTYGVFLLVFLSVVSYRVIDLKLRIDPANLYLTGANENFYSTILMRSILYPLTSFSLMFVPGDQFLSFARMVLRQIYPFFASLPQNILIAQTVILDLLSVILTLAIFLVIILLLQKEKLNSKKLLTFWLGFSLMSFLPYVLISKDFSYLEGRYYYLSLVGGAAIFSWILKRLWEETNIKWFYLLILPLSIFYLIFHISMVKGSIDEQVKLSSIRKDFILQLKSLVPTLDNDRNVFYTTSDQNFWVDENKIPFQQGSGFTLMILYYNSGKIPKEFLRDEFLAPIGSQGYRKLGNLGFGYFVEKEELDKAVKLYNIPDDSIIHLQYESDTNKLTKVDD